MVVKRWVVQRLIRWFSLAACFLSAPCLPAVARASPAPSDSVLQCVVLDHEASLREHPSPAGKAAAELNAGEPRTVRMIYFLPNDRPFRQAVVDSMKAIMRRLQTFYAVQMAAHGYGYMTFRYETDADGEPVVHRVDGDHGDAYYLETPSSHSLEGEEVSREYERESHVYFIVIDNSKDLLPYGRGWVLGIAGGGKNRGSARVTGDFGFNLAAHELTHAFGIHWHDFRDYRYVLSYGGSRRNRLSACAARRLSVHPFFNGGVPLEETRLPEIEYAFPTRRYPAGARRITIPLRVAAPEGLHQVTLRTGYSAYAGSEVVACVPLEGQTEAVVEFEYDGVVPSAPHTSLSDPETHLLNPSAVSIEGNRRRGHIFVGQSSPYLLATLKRPDGQSPSFLDVAFSPDGGILAGGSHDGTVALWDVASRRIITTLEGHTRRVNSVAFSPDGDLLASGSGDETVRLWDVASQREIAALEGHTAPVHSVAYSPDGDLLASASWESTVRLWDVASRREIPALEGHMNRVVQVAFSPDGDLLASASRDGTVRLWDVASRREIAALEGHTREANSVAFSPDGDLLASGGRDGTVKLWDVASRREIAALTTQDGWLVRFVAFSPEGGFVAAATYSIKVELLDVVGGELLETYWTTAQGSSIAFSPDGGTMAITAEHEVELWNMSPYTNPETRSPDWDGDGAVGFGDFVKFAAKFGFSRGKVGYDPRFDLDRDGEVGFSDFLILARAFGQSG